MATLLFSVLGTLIGGPIGGAIGALVGREADRALIGSPKREGSRLKELSVTTSSYGTPIPRVFGRMRVPGTILWATDLIEHKDKQGGGKGKPSITTYSYSASFAVALSSRPLNGIGRIWADGNLLRGSAGDMKAGGVMRFHSGHADQQPDPLLAAAEGVGLCPAYRGLAYVVFEDLQLGDFGNRIPALTFEVLADEGTIRLAQLLDGVVEDVACDLQLDGIAGISCEGPLADLLGQIDPAFPLDCNVSGATLSIGAEAGNPVIQLPEAAVSVADGAFGMRHGFVRKRLPPQGARPEILLYYDVDRDYQPGLQRAPGRPGAGQPGAIELPAAMNAANARLVATRIARRAGWARQSLSWRSAELDPAIAPGSLVAAPGQAGLWRVGDWEWRESGVELTLWRTGAVPAEVAVSDPGRLNSPPDDPVGQTRLQAFELPWDGLGSGDIPLIFVAASSASPGWSGAALYADQGDGQLHPLGPSGRSRAIMGDVLESLPAASPHLFDRMSRITVALVSDGFSLASASPRQLALGANRALVGNELIQFAQALPQGDGVWQISGLMRGRGGTEAAIGGHGPGERFVLLDGNFTPLDAAGVGELAATTIVAIGLGDEMPVSSGIACRGVTRRPLSPVHPRRSTDGSGNVLLEWTRRARGAWAWLDNVETPLNEEAESYQVIFRAAGNVASVWTVIEPRIQLSADQFAALALLDPLGRLEVRQQGRFALSEPLLFPLTA